MLGNQEKLAVLISANLSQYNRGMAQIDSRTRQTMGRSTAAVRSFDAQMKSAAITARGFMAMFGVTIGIAGVSRLIDQLDDLGKIPPARRVAGGGLRDHHRQRLGDRGRQ